MMGLRSSFQVSATLVANEFIDQYMAAANGEYVKVYLYLLRHQDKAVELDAIADALDHTEADVRRALAYWEKLGVLTPGLREPAAADPSSQMKPRLIAVEGGAGDSRTVDRSAVKSGTDKADIGAATLAVPAQPAPAAASPAAETSRREPPHQEQRRQYGAEQINKLAGDEEFAQLLYIAQKYLNKVFTQRECEVFAYLYDGLQMSTEVLEYLVEHCVQGGHNSIRYIETVALNWHERQLDTVEKAKAYSSGYMKDSFAVMKAFGLSDRHPGDMEKEMINRWFAVYGFTRELVVEACNRTLSAIHNPSFRYADKILSEWKKAGVKNLNDVEQLDRKRTKQPAQSAGRKADHGNNRFHNFEQRDTDYDSLVLEQVKSWIGEQ